MKINLKKFKAVKNILMEEFPYNLYRSGDMGIQTIGHIRNAERNDPVHILVDSWCGEERKYYARESECTETSWEDHNCEQCLTCRIIAAIEFPE